MRRCLGVVLVVGGLAAAGWGGENTPEKQEELYQKFEELIENRDYGAALKHLESWKAASPGDAELAVAEANLYYEMGSGQITMSHLPAGEFTITDSDQADGYSIVDPKTGKKVGSLDMKPGHDDTLLSQAASVLCEAWKKHPERLDIRFGEARILEDLQDFDGQLKVVREAVDYATSYPEKLRWRMGKPLLEPPDQFIPEALHGYAKQGFDAETDEGLERMRKFSELAVAKYPKHTFAYNDLAVYYDVKGDKRKSLEYLLLAHKADPKDALVTMNIAMAYENLKETKKAREFFEKTVKLADYEELKTEAQEGLERLK